MEVRILNRFKNAITDEKRRTEIQGYVAIYCSFLNESFTRSNFYQLLESTESQIIMRQHWAVIGLRKLFLTNNINRFPSKDLYHINTILMKNIRQIEYPQLQFQSLWILVYQLQIDMETCDCVVELKAIPLFLRLLQSQHREIITVVLYSLISIAKTRTRYRDLIIIRGGVTILINLIEHSKQKQLLKMCSSVLLTICGINPQPQQTILQATMQSIFWFIIEGKIIDSKTISDYFQLALLDIRRHIKLSIILERKLIPKLCSLIQSKEQSLIVASLRMLCLVSPQNVDLIDGPLLVDTLQRIKQLVWHKETMIRLWSYKFVSILVGGKQEQGKIIRNDFKLMLRAAISFSGDKSDDVKYGILRFFANLANIQPSSEYFTFILSQKVVSNTVRLLLDKDRRQRDLLRVGFVLKDICKLLACGQNADRFLANAEFRQAGGMELIDILETGESEQILNYVCLILSIF